jgi:quercetin dioxygenase-like cupin family protein
MSQVLSKTQIRAAGEGEFLTMLTHNVTIKVSTQDTAGKWLMYELTDTLGNGAPMHSHPWEETFYLLEGELEIQIGQRTFVVKPGTSIYFPENVAHSFKICSENARMLGILPGFSEGFYREVSERVTTLPPNLEVLQDIAARHNLRLFL